MRNQKRVLAYDGGVNAVGENTISRNIDIYLLEDY